MSTSDHSFEFGKKVKEQAAALASEGKDANLIAKIIFDADPAGYNYGIGIVLDTDGKAMATSETLLKYAWQELEGSDRGNYRNSASLMDDLKASVLSWQRIPEALWDSFVLALPSDAGTGAVNLAVEVALAMNSDLHAIGVEDLGWPGYKAIAKSCRVEYREYPINCVISEEGVLPIYQAGPQNTTGQVVPQAVTAQRAASLAGAQHLSVLDRAYSGFEFASLLATQGYDALMQMSYEQQIAPFIDQGIPVLIAISPTKCFRSFALRPAGMLLAFVPHFGMRKQVTTLTNTVMRARGSSFEHPITRAFVKAMVRDRQLLEMEHTVVLGRVAAAERAWSMLVRGTPIEPLFSEGYSGLFRNPNIHEGADVRLYNEHIYPVISGGRCRINVTGIPSDAALQQKHTGAFAGSCYLKA